MSRALKQRNAYKANVTKEDAKLSDLYKDDGDVDRFKATLAKLLTYKQKIEELNATILDEITDDAEVDKEIGDSAEYEDWLLGIISSLSVHVDKLSLPKPVVPATSQDSFHKSFSAIAKVKLPKLQIAKFAGEPMKWREFWDSFTNTIDKNTDLADIDKFKYLKGYLSGDAWRLCEGYSLSSENYQAVKEVLVERYGNPQLAIFSHLTALIEQSPASHSVKDLQKIFDDCEKHVRSLVGLGLKEEQYGQVFTPIILSKLPLHVKMELHRQNGSKPWELARLRELLKQEIHARDMSERQFVQSHSGNGGKPGDPKPFSNDKYQKQRGAPGRSFSGSQLNMYGKRGSAESKPCAFCGEAGHRTDKCSKFPDHQSRRQKIGPGCVRCLSSNHNAQACQSKSSCVHCKKTSHHSSLCFTLFPTKPSSAGTASAAMASVTPLNPRASDFVPAPNVTVHGTGSTGFTNMQTAVASCIGSDANSPASLRLLFDTAGFRSYITADAADQIGAKKVGQETMSLGVFEDKRRRTRTYDVVEFFVLIKDGDPIPVKANITDFITCPVFSSPIDSSVHPIISQITLAEPAADKPRNLSIDVLIGGDLYYDFVTNEQIRLADGLILLSSKLGYITAGASAFTQMSIPGQTLLLTSFPSAVDKDLNLERFWRLEDIGIKDECSSPADEVALQQVNSSRKLINGRYYVKFPRRDNAVDLPDNMALALGRLRSLFRKLSSNVPMMQKYHEILLDQAQRGIIEEAPVTPTGQIHYLPHHAVLKPESLTTPVRVVHDASSKAKKTVPSLNDTLYCGPLFLADLVGLFIRFRLHDVAIVSDIEKAFLHIGLQESDRDLVRFFWVKDLRRPPTGDNVIVYRFCRVPFGLVCSSFLLAACVLHHLSLYPEPAARLMADNLYVDNIIVSLSDADSAKVYYFTAKKIFADASLNLRQWFTNSVELRDALKAADVGKGGKVTKVMGMVWDTISDVINCPSISIFPQSVSTKRQLLQFVAKIFDPCGLFSPVTVMGKLLVQKAWEEKLLWDDPLPADFLREWERIGDSIKRIPDFPIPRNVGASRSDVFSLHCFCDASKKCYAATVLLKCGDESKPHLLFSKTKLAPLKGSKSGPKEGLTIPQLELLAVVVGCRVLRFIGNQLQLPNCQYFVWSDSQCVLHWVAQRGVATSFVKTRVREIRQIAKEYKFSFRYVRSEDNPADYASRGSHLEQLTANDVWWHGPSWLAKQVECWPESPIPVPIGDTEAPSFTGASDAVALTNSSDSSNAGVLPSISNPSNAGVLPCSSISSGVGVLPNNPTTSIAGVLPCNSDPHPGDADVLSSYRTPGGGVLSVCRQNTAGPESALDVMNYKKYSSLRKLIRVFAFVQRFVTNCRKAKADRATEVLSVAEVTSANDLLLKAVQHKHFSDVLSGNFNASAIHMVRQFGVWKDDSEILRCQTRLRFSDAEASTTFPILLPSNDHFTDLVIYDVHCRLFHAGTAHCLSELRQLYWIPKARYRTKKILRSCKLCHRLKALQFKYPDPPPLPSFRVKRQHVFETTGLDYLGPLLIRTPEGEKKVWILLFTCAVVRAIHLEVVEDMTTEQFLFAFRRFSALYGCPSLLVSDNAKQFKTANLTFKRACDDGSIAQATGSKGVQWKFIPERAPWFGGFYERLVASVKRCLRSALYFAKISLAELQTISYEISACLNTRPLTYVESELESVSLCPANFLLKGRPVILMTLSEQDEWRQNPGGKEAVLVLSWRRNIALLDRFWDMWQRAYLTGLKENERYLKQRNVIDCEPELGMTVLVSDKMPKGHWQLARIVALNKSSDGVIRSADVQLPNGTRLKRPLKLLCPLEASADIPGNAIGDNPVNNRLRPVRQAAVRARHKIQEIAKDDELSDDNDEGSLNQTVLVCVPVFYIDEHHISEMRKVIYFERIDNISLYKEHRPGFYIADRCFTSVFMAAIFMQMVQDDKEALAHEMHLVPHLRSDPFAIPSWCKDHGYVPSATAVFRMPDILKNLFLCQLEDQGPLHDIVKEFVEQTGFQEDWKIIACGKDYVYECGLRLNHAVKKRVHDLPGFNQYGQVLTEVMVAYMRNAYTPDIYTEFLVKVPGFIPREDAEKTVLVLSDSMCGSIKDIAGGTIISKSGATFEKLLEKIQRDDIRFGPYAYVIVHCGINDIQKGRLPAQVMFLQFLDYLQSVEMAIREYPPSRILISLPILHPDIPEAFEYSVLLRHYCEPRGIRSLDWTSPDFNPFLDGYMWHPRLSADDEFHVNHAGVTELWKAWARVFTQLQTVPYSMKQDPVRRQHAVQH